MTGLSSVLSQDSTETVTVLKRKPNPYGSTFPTEIVQCRLNGQNGDKPVSLFVKYGTRKFDKVYGHRRGLSYEARVYGEVLQSMGVSTPKFYGLYKDGPRKTPWLIMEYMSQGRPASWLKDPIGMVRSAGWIGRFHAANEKRVQDGKMKFLRKYDSDYYHGWAKRTKRLFKRVHSSFPWLAPLCVEFEQKIPVLVEAPQTIIHGEYFGVNVLYQHGVSRPIDWQSAAIAPGEVDLASLTHSWVSPVVHDCEREYARSRWPKGPPDSFPEILDVARVYMNLRWLGDPKMMLPLVTPTGRPRVKMSVFLAMQALLDLHSVGRRLELIQ